MPIWDKNSGRGATHFAEVRLVAASAPVTETVFFTEAGWALPVPGCATTRLSYYLSVRQAGTGGQLSVRLKWTDNSGVQQVYDSASVQTNQLGDVATDTPLVHVKVGEDVTYEVIETGSPTGYLFDFFLHAEHM